MSTTNEIVIVGIGETAEMAYEYFTIDSPYKVVAFAAEENYLKERFNSKSEMFGVPIVEIEKLSQKFPPKRYRAFVAMASGRLNHDRAKMYNFMCQEGYDLVSYISSRAFIGVDVTFGKNCFVMENCCIQRKVQIGNDVLMWSGSGIAHGGIVKDHVFFAPNAVVAGYSEIGEYTFLGVNSCVADKVKIAENCFIDGGVYISRDTKPYELFFHERAKADNRSTYEFFKIG